VQGFLQTWWLAFRPKRSILVSSDQRILFLMVGDNPVSELYHGLVFPLTCTVNCGAYIETYQTMSNQLNLPEVDSSQVVDDQWKQDAPELNFKCHSKVSVLFIFCKKCIQIKKSCHCV
jgi:hypothetical protein